MTSINSKKQEIKTYMRAKLLEKMKTTVVQTPRLV